MEGKEIAKDGCVADVWIPIFCRFYVAVDIMWLDKVQIITPKLYLYLCSQTKVIQPN